MWTRTATTTLVAACLAGSLGACQPDEQSTAPSVAPSTSTSAALAEQAVLLHLATSTDPAGLDPIEEPLMEALDGTDIGYLDGNAVGSDDAVIYLYGPSADRLWSTIEPTLRAAPVPPGSYAIKRYGDAGAREVRVPMPQAIHR
jgi:hypothetical protein